MSIIVFYTLFLHDALPIFALVGVFAPVLTAQGPGVGLVGQVQVVGLTVIFGVEEDDVDAGIDRKRTRLNSSHVRISYAAFCLKKKTIEVSNPNLLFIV